MKIAQHIILFSLMCCWRLFPENQAKIMTVESLFNEFTKLNQEDKKKFLDQVLDKKK